MVDNLLGIPETKLPEDPATARIEAGEDAAKVAADLPSSVSAASTAVIAPALMTTSCCDQS